ncbi:MAG: ribosome silencing factor [Prevotellaceae bacterium]|nr:ribosome silencing factor [Prevotellaceae bacterium]
MKKKNKEKLVEAIVAGLQEKKGRDIVVADLTEIEDAVCRFFVICSGGSPQQVQALAHSVGETCRTQADAKPLAVDGLRNAEWVAMDFADVIVHIFLPDLRAFYDIEHLWADADLQNIPNLD